MNILAELRSRFSQTLSQWTDDPDRFAEMVQPSQDSNFGDFQANCAMPLAKQQKTNPRDLASQIVEQLKIDDLCEQPEVAGPGFINLKLKQSWLVDQTNALLGDDRLGVPVAQPQQTIIVDYSAPNVAKPMHVGHLRSSVIGSALYNVLKFQGHHAVSDNHIGDWGTQFGMIIYGYKNFLDKQSFEKEPVTELARLYRLVNQLSDYIKFKQQIPELEKQIADKQDELDQATAELDESNKKAKKALKKLRSDVANLKSQLNSATEKVAAVDKDSDLKAKADSDPDIAVNARLETAKLHSGDEENRQLWDQFLPQCLKALDTIYDRLNIEFDMALGESYYQPMLADVVDELKTSGLARESEGAVCVFQESSTAPFIVQKQDNAFTYATTDLATIRYRVQELNADLILYVVDSRQGGHFKLLFETAQQWGYENVGFQHVSFGTILGDDKRPFKTRSGDTVGLESLIDESIKRAREIVDQNDNERTDAAGNPDPQLDEQTRADVANAIGIGGIKYADLRHNRESDYVFSWDKMLAKTGNTATYMQYSYARICGIFRKGEVTPDELLSSGTKIELAERAERQLALHLNRFAEALDATARECRPNILTNYLFETANHFSTFYEQCSVLKESNADTRNSRLLLCHLTASILQKGLSLLGIETCEKM